MGEHSVAVVIPVLDEVGNIGVLLDDLAAQQAPPDEIIVVDAGSTDGTWELLSARRATSPGLKVERVLGATPGRGRNEGIRVAAATTIVTLDAGSRIGPTWLAALTGALGVALNKRAVVGVADADARSEFERAAGWFTLHAFKPSDRPGPLADTFLPAGRNGYCFTRAAWTVAGGYPPHLAWGEDKVFLRRLRESGFEIVVAPDAIVRWRPRRSLTELYRQYARYGRGDAMAGVDRRNTLVTLGLYTVGARLVYDAARGRRIAVIGVCVAPASYLGLFVLAARRRLGVSWALAWVPPIRVVVDAAKMHGFLAELLRRSLLRACPKTRRGEVRPGSYARLVRSGELGGAGWRWGR